MPETLVPGAVGGSPVSPGTGNPRIPSGLELFLQAWLPDPGAVQGFSASNALRAKTP
jgi:hypothetical protein